MSNPTGEKNGITYFQNLDALRFLAAFGVLIFHYFRDIKSFYPGIEDNQLFRAVLVISDKGGLGVNFFFVLSGFLITYLILQEKERTGNFSLLKFLIRRSLRIWPLYFIVVIVGFVLFPLLFQNYHTEHHAINYIFFLANFDEIWYGARDGINFLTAPWSVAVEEQFYFGWSLLLWPLLKFTKFRIEWIILLLYLISFYFRWMNLHDERIIYYHTLSVCQDILTGAFIGCAVFKRAKWVDNVAGLSVITIGLIYLTGLGIIVGKNILFQGDLHLIERFVLSLFFGFVLIDQAFGKNSPFKVGRIRFLNYLGTISYGIYMYHLIVMFVFCRYVEMALPTGYYLIPVYFAVSVVGTILIAGTSYKFIEKPLLDLKHKFK